MRIRPSAKGENSVEIMSRSMHSGVFVHFDALDQIFEHHKNVTQCKKKHVRKEWTKVFNKRL